MPYASKIKRAECGQRYRAGHKDSIVVYQKKWRDENRERVKTYHQRYNEKQRELLQNYVDELKTGPCSDCGKCFHPVAMDFDHVRGRKHRSISQLIARHASLDAIDAEIAKCELVCACCHRVRTLNRDWRRHASCKGRIVKETN